MQSSYSRKPPARPQGGSGYLFDMDTCCSDALPDWQMLRKLQTELQRKKMAWLFLTSLKHKSSFHSPCQWLVRRTPTTRKDISYC
ncbi:MAG: hypothetical protein ABI723_18435 [Bacteroidia bacterium]